MLKKAVKRLAQTALATIGPGRLHPGPDPKLVILTYHRVLPDTEPDRAIEQPGMYVSPETLDMHLSELKSRFELIHLGRWIQMRKNGERLPDYACAITFDDGWRDNYRYAYPVLQKHQAPATIFVVSEFVGSHYRFWPNRLARLLTSPDTGSIQRMLAGPAGRWLGSLDLDFEPAGQGRLDMAKVDQIIEKSKRYSEEELLGKLDAMESDLGVTDDDQSPDMLSWEQLREMHSSGLVDVGSHTCRHTRLIEGLETAVIQREIAASKNKLEAQLGGSIDTFCYPNGDYTAAAVQMVSQTYKAACTTRRGWNTASADPSLLKRISVHEDVTSDRNAFLARLSGYL